jgi:hypothetical protein
MNKKWLSPLLFLLLLSITLYSAPLKRPFAERIANYQMDVRLDVETRTISGSEILSWLNTSNEKISELHFHLYLNAFKNNKSTLIKEAAMDPRRGRLLRRVMSKKEYWGYIDVKKVTLLDEMGKELTELTDTIAYIQPDDGNTYDQTVMRITLPVPVEPKKTVILKIEFISRLPRCIARTGWVRDFFFVAQWFPKIGVYQDGKWNCHQFHANSEFFADFGIYDARITIPREYVIGASGNLIDKKENADGTITYRFYEEDIHDFAWTISKHYLVYNDKFVYPSGHKVKLTLLIQKEHRSQKDRYLKAFKAALECYGKWFGEYPYDNFTLVDPAYGSHAGGMEYPTIFTGGTNLFPPKEYLSPEGVTIHEAGHNWWYGMVANNEFEDAWLDEGFNSYSDERTAQAAYLKAVPLPNKLYWLYFGFPYVFREVELKVNDDQWSRYRQMAKCDILARYAWEYMNGSSYSVNAYSKASLMFWTLRGLLGSELEEKIMKTYFEQARFTHPKPADYFKVVNEVTGEDWSWFFGQLVYGSEVVDYAVEMVSSYPPFEKTGWFEENGKKVFLDGRPKEEEITYHSTVIIRREGEVKLPVEILIVFENGEKVKKVWDWKDQYRWVKLTFDKPVKLKYAVVDPDRKIPLDIDYINNSMTREEKKLPVFKWAYRWMIWFSHFLETMSFFS